MAVVPFRWQGAARLERLRLLLNARAHEWKHGWAVAPDDFECAIDFLDPHQSDSRRSSDRWYEVKGSNGALYACAPAKCLDLLGGRLAGTGTTDIGGLAAGIGRRAFADLLQTLIGASSPSQLVEINPPETALLLPRSGAASVQLLLAGLPIAVYLDVHVCDALIPRAAQTVGGLAKRTEAILQEKITLTAVLDLGSVSLESTGVLRPGEIIKTAMGLDAAVVLTTESGETVAAGALVASDGYRALRCERITR